MNHLETRQYRLQARCRNIGVAGALFFLSASILSVVVALTNPDGSIARPLLAAAFFTVFWGAFFLGSIWLILAFYRYRLSLDPMRVWHVGVWRQREGDLRSLYRVKWRVYPAGGSIVLTFRDGRIKIDLGDFTDAERTEIVAYFRDRVGHHLHTGWDKFQNQRLIDNVERARKLRRARYALASALMIFAISFFVAGFMGLGSHYFLFGVANLVVGVWGIRASRKTQPV